MVVHDPARAAGLAGHAWLARHRSLRTRESGGHPGLRGRLRSAQGSVSRARNSPEQLYDLGAMSEHERLLTGAG
ncbi:hypothetical protein BIWAKO_00972 [Bosea sp. BIWAKO-01]|nr:hypothetical protein BIWAKO_00972 [Bosea sp. BIWAKO-01]